MTDLIILFHNFCSAINTAVLQSRQVQKQKAEKVLGSFFRDYCFAANINKAVKDYSVRGIFYPKNIRLYGNSCKNSEEMETKDKRGERKSGHIPDMLE